MDDDEFLYHLDIIKDLTLDPSIRIILFHPPYTTRQQKIVDSICRRTNNIIGQLERSELIGKRSNEISRLIKYHNDPYLKPAQIKYVILGQQRIKN